MKRFLFLIAVFALSISVGCGSLDYDDCGDSPYLMSSDCRPLSWGLELPVPLFYGSSMTAEAKQATDNAIATWESETGINLFEVHGIQDDPVGSESNQLINIIGMRQGQGWSQGPIAGKSDEPAKTVYYHRDFLYNAKFFFNTSYPLALNADSNTFDLTSIAIHELGHVLGLDHDDEISPNHSVMNSKIDKGIVRQSLSARDIERIRALYAI